MATVGSACVILGLCTAIYGAGAALYGVRAGRPEFVVSARRAMYALAGLMLCAFAILESAFVRTDLSFGVVADNSSTTTPTFYKLTATWGSQSGSLLLWCSLLAVFSSIVLYVNRNRLREIVPYAIAVLCGIAAFFLFLMVFYASPFTTIAHPPAEGAGLNPLLRHPSMMFHPPALYSGYVGFSIPFAFAIGALVTRQLDSGWLRAVRRYALLAWFLLGIGILLGARWSYAELGWGGYWAWDPVENASLMPWLVGTAFLHSIVVQERRGMLKVWNMALIISTFTLALLGTFLVRSGILDSIHAFGASTLGVPFLIFIGVVLVGSVGLLVTRLDDLRSERRLDSLLSREAAFLVNNLLLVGLTFVIFWGTFFPLISEAVTGDKASVGPPWFDQYITPLALALVLMAGLGPLIAWRKATWASVRSSFVAPVAVALVSLVGLLALSDAATSIPSLIMFTLCAFTITALLGELWRGTRARSEMAGEPLPEAFVGLIRRNRRRYGGYVVHMGIAIIFIGVAASSAFQTNRDTRLAPGQSTRVAGYNVHYLRATATGDSEKLSFGAVLSVRRDGHHVATLRPSRSYFPTEDGRMGVVGRFFGGESTSEVGMRPGLTKDLWTAIQPNLRSLKGPIREANRRFAKAPPEVLGVVLGAIIQRYQREPRAATFRTIVSPLVTWIWVGGIVVIGGGLIALWPSPAAVRRRLESLQSARLGRELSKA